MSDNMNKALADALAYGTGVMHKSDYVAHGDVYLGPRDGIIEEQALEIVGLTAQLQIVLDREADTQRRHDAKVEALEAEIEYLRKRIDSMIESMADITALAMPAQFVIDRGETK